MSKTDKIALGLDFGTESVRGLLVDLAGNERGSAVSRYRHGQITEALPATGEPLPAEFALQHPADWIEGAAKVARAAVKSAGIDPQQVIGVGVDFTSCTMLPALADGVPLCLTESWSGEKYAWPKLWKHHAAHEATARINRVARHRKEPWLARYGGVIGLEWFFPKILETLTAAPAVYEAAEVWIEAGDWFVWQLVGGEASQLPRSTCQAGYKAMWNKHDGYPSEAFFKAVDPRLQHVIARKMPGVLLAPGERAGELTAEMARKLGLAAGTPVSAATIDAHAGVPGAGAAEPDTLVMVMGTSSCHMLNSAEEHLVPGVAGVVDGGILPGMFGYETGQAAVGDAFDWLRQLVGAKDFDSLTQAAAQLPPGAEGVRCVDWFHGCRTPLMDGALRGAFTGLSLGHRPHHLYRALLEASACGVRWIIELLEEHGVPVRKCLATGGLPHHNPLLVQIYADVLGRPLEVPPSKQGPALGAAILAALAAGCAVTGFSSPQAAIRAMAAPVKGNTQRQRIVVKPNGKARSAYNGIYDDYRRLAEVVREV